MTSPDTELPFQNKYPCIESPSHLSTTVTCPVAALHQRCRHDRGKRAVIFKGRDSECIMCLRTKELVATPSIPLFVFFRSHKIGVNLGRVWGGAIKHIRSSNSPLPYPNPTSISKGVLTVVARNFYVPKKDGTIRQ